MSRTIFIDSDHDLLGRTNRDNPARLAIRDRKYEPDTDRCISLGAWVLEKRPELAEQYEREIYPEAS